MTATLKKRFNLQTSVTNPIPRASPPEAMKFGAYVTCGCHPDMDTACNLVRGGFSVQTRFGVMHDKTSGPLTESQ